MRISHLFTSYFLPLSSPKNLPLKVTTCSEHRTDWIAWKVGEGKKKLITQWCNLPNWVWVGEDDSTEGSSEVHVHMPLENSISSPRSLILLSMEELALMSSCTASAQEPHTASLLERAGSCFMEDTPPPQHYWHHHHHPPPTKYKQSSSSQASHREDAHSPTLVVSGKWITDGLQERIFKCSWFFLLFSVGACHETSENLVPFYFLHTEGY